VKWRTSTTPYTIRVSKDFEPYIVWKKSIVRYDTRFLGFGWNKVSHIMALDAEEYEFVVLPDVFIIHQPHSPSMEIGRYRTSRV
jgi:glycosyltransferase-like protein LARGE